MECFIKVYLFILLGVSLVTPFSWKDCGEASEPIRITSLDVYLNASKIMYVSGKAKVATNITGPIQGRIEMKKKFFWGWTDIPCIDNLGSCTYEDICTADPFKDKPCPSEFTDNGLPCKCPIPQGQFRGKNIPFDLSILPHWIEKGKYRIILTLHKENLELACLLMIIDL